MSGDRYRWDNGLPRCGEALGCAWLALPRFNIMQNIYAATPKGLIYHLLAEHHRTLCGLYVVGDLHLVAEKPKDRILCKHCESVMQNVPLPKFEI